ASLRPGLVGDIDTHFAVRGDLPALVLPARLMPGGETIKNEAHLLGEMHDVILDHGIDRHSYVVAVGGGAFLDAVGL
ncbi:hypothetical protein ABTL66_19820, partial [Acinetobacter baumannii]